MKAVPVNADLVTKINWSFNEIQALNRRVNALGGSGGGVTPTLPFTAGTVDLVLGVGSVTNPIFTGVSNLFLSIGKLKNAAGTAFYVPVASLGPGTFTITAYLSDSTTTSTADISTINWLILHSS